MIELGLIVALGLLVTLAKLPWRCKIWMTSHPLACDLGVAALITWIHWGTYSGVMVATIAALCCSLVLALARRLIGFIEGGRYVRGFFDISTKL